MDVTIKVKQDIVNGEIRPKKYDLSVVIKYGTGYIHWQKDAYLYDLDADTIKELIPLLNQRLEEALLV